MSRQGTIAVIDREQAAIAIRTGDGEYTIVEVPDEWALDVGDVIAWDEDEGLGFDTYRNLGKGTEGDVFVQNHYVDEQAMRRQFPA